MTEFLGQVNGVVWGIPMIVLIMGTGIYLTIRLGLLQFRKLGKALYYMSHNEKDVEGEVTSFAALCTALAATIGSGNIVGVATAMGIGGPGALFWMVLAACFGMATKYAEGVLAIKYRTIDSNGKALGGPFMYIEKGLGVKYKWLAVLFAIFAIGAGLLGIGTMVQTNSVVSAVQAFFDPQKENTIMLFGNEYTIALTVAAVVVAALTALVILGGIKRISSVATLVVPFMAVLYVVVAIAILAYNFEHIPAAFATIFKSAFGADAVAGGVIGAILVSVQAGVARGIFSNEAGLGSAPIATAAAQTKEPVRQGLVAMTGTFFDTVIICTMTGLTIVITGSWNIEGLEGSAVTINAFANGLPWSYEAGAFVLMISLAFFAFTTILGWNYYAERCLVYLTGEKKSVITGFRLIWILTVLIGPFVALETVWLLADTMNGLMALPNLIALLVLGGVVVKETKSYFERLNSGQITDR